MKKTFFLITALLVICSLTDVNAQIINESAKRKVTVGVDVFTDIWLNTPENMDLRTINQGSNVFIQYNIPVAKSKTISFAAGISIDNHNMYSNTRIDNIKADTIVFTPIDEKTDYKRSKINIVSITAPLELKFRWKSGFKISAGMKLGYVFDSKEKYVGTDPEHNGLKITEKRKEISQLDNFTYGPTLRIGYKVINIFAYYRINKIFKLGHGPQINPISVGITITPF